MCVNAYNRNDGFKALLVDRDWTPVRNFLKSGGQKIYLLAFSCSQMATQNNVLTHSIKCVDTIHQMC